MDSFGAYLKTHREKKGIRLEEIASITKIHLHALELLEGGKWESLPPEPFIRGFILAYAKYVGLSTSEVLERYREATGHGTNAPAPTASTSAASPTSGGMVSAPPNEIITQVRLPSGPKMITAASLIAVVGLTTLLINVGRESEQPVPTQVTTMAETPATEVAAAPAAAKPEETRKVAEAPTKAVTAAPPVPENAAAHELTVEGKERSWMKIVIDENPPQETYLAEGKSSTYRAKNKIKLVLGNAAGAKVTHNGKETDGKLFSGTIRYYKFPENAQFPQDIPKKPASENQEANANTSSSSTSN